MYRNLIQFFSREPISSTATESSANDVQSKSIEQTEALRDLYSTYVHPVKCFNKTYSKKIAERKNLISVLKQRETGLINFHRYPTARHQLMDRY
ncbi:hypothetical protein I4U23_018394 [Adineta vaga]|nr:hypothetical protein I4U23_018394 [Adineta vaga]